MVDNKMKNDIPDELGETLEAKQFRLKRMSEMDNPCPKCHLRMTYVQDAKFEGWLCNTCKTWTPIGTPEDFEANKTKVAPRQQAPKDKLVQYANKFKKGKGGGPRSGCSGC